MFWLALALCHTVIVERDVPIVDENNNAARRDSNIDADVIRYQAGRLLLFVCVSKTGF